ncbi:hypothetical protein [Gulosibacter sp. 10]|uniref:hypothetical protein n=1 Tax=Gulosibacter sp. 10 TaxID=1255570 RepID=UPI00097F2457|nr:hypothetical protein [Gulosibacter sp. 10]SJM49335.1 putative integral membrane protein [Gulosibacter sp. 10]
MGASASASAGAATRSEAPRSAPGAFLDAFRAELSKLLSLGSFRAVIAGTIALTAVATALLTQHAEFTVEADPSGETPHLLDFGVVGLGWTQVGFFLAGVLAATSEYVGGQIRTTLLAVPNRLVQKTAAMLALAVLVFPGALLAAATGVGVVLASTGTVLEALEPALTARVLCSAAGYLACMAVLSAAVGSLVRKTVPAAAILVVYLLVVSPLLQGLRWYFLPDMASYTFWYVISQPGAPPPFVGWIVVLAWTLGAAAVAALVFRRRDT